MRNCPRYDQAMETWMRKCLELATQAAAEDEVPVGAMVISADGEILGQGYNHREKHQSVLAHAELIAIAQATENRGSWRLSDCTLYSTLEPCVMCSGAIVQARLARVVYGATDPKGGGHTLFSLLNHPQLNHRTEVITGVLAEECGSLLSQFFKRKRQSTPKGEGD